MKNLQNQKRVAKHTEKINIEKRNLENTNIEIRNLENKENPERIEKVKSIVKKAGDSITECQPENNGQTLSLSI